MKKTLIILLAVIMVFAFAACNNSTPEPAPAPAPAPAETTAPEATAPEVEEVVCPPADLVYMTNPVGTGYYTVGAGQGALLTTDTPLNVIVTPSTGPDGIVAGMKAGEADLGVNCGEHFITYWEATPVVDYGLENLRSIQNGNVLCFSLIVNADSGIKTISDLKGKRVTFDGLSDSHIQITEAILRAYGLDPFDDIQREKMSFSTSGLVDLAEGRTDACIGSIAGSKLEELASKITPLVLPIENAEALKVAEMYPAVVPAPLFSDVPGGAKGMPLVGMPTVLYCMDDMDDAIPYTIAKTLVENYDSISVISEELEQWTREAAASPNAKFPYHPGAIKYYEEVGLWTPELQAWNDGQIKLYAGK